MSIGNAGLSRARLSSQCKLLTVVLMLCAISAAPATAHRRSLSFSSWFVDDLQIHAVFTVRADEASRFATESLSRGPLAPDRLAPDRLNVLLLEHLDASVTARRDSRPCRPTTAWRALASDADHLRFERHFECDSGGPLELQSSAFVDTFPEHVHHARLRTTDGDLAELVLTEAERQGRIDLENLASTAAWGTIFADYIRLGIEHILIGTDHVAFVLALLLLCTSLRQATMLVTGFTLGHSLTLSLAALGIIVPHGSVVESLIGFTIALVAFEIVAAQHQMQRPAQRHTAQRAGLWVSGLLLASAGLAALGALALPASTLLGLALFAGCYLRLVDDGSGWRILLTAAFGLIHGFGFAGVLQEIGLPASRRVTALLGFNLGVEIGQLMIILVAGGLGGLLFKRLPLTTRAGLRVLAASGLCAAGTFWFVSRAL